MSVAEMQAMFARLCVDEAFREWFLLAPDSAAAKYRLTFEESSALRSIDAHNLRVFGKSLRERKHRALPQRFPLCFGVMKNRLFEYCDRYFDLHPPQPGVGVNEWNMAFGRFLLQSLATDSDFPPVVRDICLYECVVYELGAMSFRQASASFNGVRDDSLNNVKQESGARVVAAPGSRLVRFSYDIRALVVRLRDNLTTDLDDKPEPTFVVFNRPAANANLQMFAVSAVVADLLESCRDGAAISDLATILAPHFSEADNLGQAVDRIVADLVAKQLAIRC